LRAGASPAPTREEGIFLGPWFLLLALSQTADLATTWWGWRVGVPESNPFVAGLLARGELLTYAAVKVSLVLAFFLLFRARRSPVTMRGVQLVSVAFCVIAVLNTIGIATA